MEFEDDGQTMQQGEDAALRRPSVDEVGVVFARGTDGAPGEGAAGGGFQPADFEGLFQPVEGFQVVAAAAPRRHIGDEESHVVPKPGEGLRDFHHLYAVGVRRRDARHGDGEDFHVYPTSLP